MSQRHWDILEERDMGQFHVIIDKSWEDMHPKDLFDTSIDPETGLPYFDIEDICRKIDSYDLEWFMLRARVFYEDVELGEHILGGFLYEDAREVLKDGVADDVVYGAVCEAKTHAYRLKEKFHALDLEEMESWA